MVPGKSHDYCDRSGQSHVSAIASTRRVVRNARLEGSCGNEAELAAALVREQELLREKSELLQRQEMLAQEFEHRLVNGLQEIVSLLSLQSRAAPTIEAAIDYRGRARGRVWTRTSTVASPRSSEER